MPPAAERVFQLPELHEHILSFLPPGKIAQARTINKYTNANILNSPTLRRKMFGFDSPPSRSLHAKLCDNGLTVPLGYDNCAKYNYQTKLVFIDFSRFHGFQGPGTAGTQRAYMIEDVLSWDFAIYKDASVAKPVCKKMQFSWKTEQKKQQVEVITLLESETGVTLEMLQKHVHNVMETQKKKLRSIERRNLGVWSDIEVKLLGEGWE